MDLGHLLNESLIWNTRNIVIVFVTLVGILILFFIRRKKRKMHEDERLTEFENFSYNSFIKKSIFIVLGILIVLTMIFGVIGFLSMPHYNFKSAFYSSIRLFTINFDASIQTPYPGTLEIARWTGTFATYLTLIQIIIFSSGEVIRRYYITWFSHNTVIVGSNEYSYQLAESLLKGGTSVVFISNEEDEWVHKIRSYGGVVVLGDAKNYEILRKARVTFANEIVLFMMSDAENIEVAFRFTVMKEKQKKRLLIKQPNSKIFIHLEDPQMQFQFEKPEYQERLYYNQNYPTHFFNVHEISARMLFNEYPLYKGQDILSSDAPPIHLLIVGFNSIGKNVILQASKIGHYPNGKKIKITVVDKEIRKKQALFNIEYPFINKTCDFNFVDLDMENIESTCIPILKSVTKSVICLDGDALDYALFLQLFRDLQFKEVAMYGPHHSNLYNSLKEKRGFGHVYNFGAIEEIANHHVIIDQSINEIAIAQNSIINPNMHIRWDETMTSQKSLMTATSDFIDTILYVMGFQKIKKVNYPNEEFITKEEYYLKSEGYLNMLSKIEHERWRACLFIDGWLERDPNGHFIKDTENKHHPLLVPWEDLEEISKEHGIDYNQYNIQYIINLYDILTNCGYGIMTINENKMRDF